MHCDHPQGYKETTSHIKILGGTMYTLEVMKKVTAEVFEGICSSQFLEWLEKQGFYTAPSSKGHHSAERGGNWAHSYQVGYELVRLTEQLNLKWDRWQSPMIIGLLHDFCKLDNYKFGEKEIEWNKEGTYPGHGEKSLLMLMSHIDLTEEEKYCIRYHMGAFTDSKEWPYYSRAVKKYPNVLWTHTADMIASQIKQI